jgi:hypothetical protein
MTRRTMTDTPIDGTERTTLKSPAIEEIGIEMTEAVGEAIGEAVVVVAEAVLTSNAATSETISSRTWSKRKRAMILLRYANKYVASRLCIPVF